jgi:hypothetical protein
MTEDLNTPGRWLFPEYAKLAGMYAREVYGLTDEQVDLRRPDKSWGRWSIREQVSHMAFVNYRWFSYHWGDILLGVSRSIDKSLGETASADRMLDPFRFHEIGDLLTTLRDGFDLAWEILAKETLGSMREKVQWRRMPAHERWPSGDSPREWTENVILKTHPSGFWRDKKDPDLFHYNLEFTFRHVLWEAYAHLKTVQTHEILQGLDPKVVIPYVGYIPTLSWE